MGVTNYLLTGMILQVWGAPERISCKKSPIWGDEFAAGLATVRGPNRVTG